MKSVRPASALAFSEFAFSLAKEMEARDIEVPKKKNGDPNIQTSKSAFKQWLLEHDKETVEQDSGNKSFKPVFPELWAARAHACASYS